VPASRTVVVTENSPSPVDTIQPTVAVVVKLLSSLTTSARATIRRVAVTRGRSRPRRCRGPAQLRLRRSRPPAGRHLRRWPQLHTRYAEPPAVAHLTPAGANIPAGGSRSAARHCGYHHVRNGNPPILTWLFAGRAGRDAGPGAWGAARYTPELTAGPCFLVSALNPPGTASIPQHHPAGRASLDRKDRTTAGLAIHRLSTGYSQSCPPNRSGRLHRKDRRSGYSRR
jgi:hypothetical protein